MNLVVLSVDSAAYETAPPSLNHSSSNLSNRLIPLTALASATFLLHGYHPYSQDGAIYVAGLERTINPSLFQADAIFVDGHSRLSLFSHLLAWISVHAHLPFNILLLLIYCVSIFAFLFASHLLAMRLFRSEYARWSSTLLAAVCLTMPAAATSLLVADPYLTARSLSTPLTLLAIVACLDRSWTRMAICTLLACSLHPLMGIYLIGFLLTLMLLSQRRLLAALGLCGAAFLLCGLIAWITRHDPVSPYYREAALSRTYYFLSRWQWEEILGLIAPLLLMAIAAVKSGLRSNAGKLCLACVFTGATSCLASLCFVHPDHPDLLMRLQVLRSFHTIYVLGLVMLGGFIGLHILRRRVLPGIAVLIIAIAGMAFGDHQSYPVSSHIEWPWERPTSPEEQAFLWVRAHTPPQALFASDSTATHSSDDEPGFRAMAERSTLNDSKDEGVSSLFPALAAVWGPYRDAQRGLNQLTDAERTERLRPYGVTWILLSPQATTAFSCPYRNSAVAVCQINTPSTTLAKK
ncbi:hypothetical protein [Tunturibacter empetritectus]|uniref:Uncharacterized protein n=1 Tax=Tunturiibacter empetritectus TaxID=3069691 RepID=A0A7W8IFA4_9BACT|nr:hypothetical protein [Edaphobacter lichenicola]MBB5316158.1 hypothetical protein [Edaphobacter lichenicola]